MPTEDTQEMFSAEQIAQIKADAKAKLDKEVHDKAVAEHVEVLKARKLHFLPKRIVLQWPVRLEDWYKKPCRRSR